MWLFRRKIKKESHNSSLSCPFCNGSTTRLIIHHGGDVPSYVKVWRWQRFLTYKCLDCGQNFYANEPKGGISEKNLEDGPIIDDEDALRAAEEDLKRQTEEDDDRRYR
jgi:transcription elongation factor Elf1